MSTNHPLVCVVVPILDEARYLRESMNSLLAQDYRPLEIVVYDAGSTDGTLEILKDYPVSVIVEPGLGQMAAINRGWRRTDADFVIWWAGDDISGQGYCTFSRRIPKAS
jgi:glycosyltransferase involved in cell wall biosynthesis